MKQSGKLGCAVSFSENSFPKNSETGRANIVSYMNFVARKWWESVTGEGLCDEDGNVRNLKVKVTRGGKEVSVPVNWDDACRRTVTHLVSTLRKETDYSKKCFNRLLEITPTYDERSLRRFTDFIKQVIESTLETAPLPPGA